MSDKEVVIETLRDLPETATFQQITEEISLLAAIRRGEEAADAGRGVSHEAVRERIRQYDMDATKSIPASEVFAEIDRRLCR